MNISILIGRLVYEPEVKTSSNGNSYLSTRIAVPRNDKDKTSDFITVKAWGKTAEFVGKYFKKGEPISVTGEIRTDSYEKQDGTKVNETFVAITKAEFVPGKKAETTERNPEPQRQPNEIPDDGLPFQI